MPVKTFMTAVRGVRRWIRAPLTLSTLSIGRLMTAIGSVLAGAGERMSAWALDRLAVIGARSERRYPILAVLLAVLAWVPVILLLKGCF